MELLQLLSLPFLPPNFSSFFFLPLPLASPMKSVDGRKASRAKGGKVGALSPSSSSSFHLPPSLSEHTHTRSFFSSRRMEERKEEEEDTKETPAGSPPAAARRRRRIGGAIPVQNCAALIVLQCSGLWRANLPSAEVLV